jgi:hypothetical protein
VAEAPVAEPVELRRQRGRGPVPSHAAVDAARLRCLDALVVRAGEA